MTEEKAVKTLETIINIIEQDDDDIVTRADIPLLQMAVDALNEQIKNRSVNGPAEDHEEYGLPSWYAEVEYEDLNSLEAVQGMKFDDMNYMRYMER